MKQIKVIFFSLFAIALFSNGKTEDEIGKKYLDDFNSLITTLKEIHPVLYRNIGKDEFDREVNEISGRLLHTKSRYDAIYMIQELMFRIGSAHAGNVSVYEIYNDTNITKVLPFSVYIIDKQLYIKNYAADTMYNGAKIISIEKTNSKTLVDSLKIFFPVDGNRDVVDFYLQPYFNVLYGAFCKQKNSFAIVTEKGPLQVDAAIRGTKLFENLVLKADEIYLGKERVLKTEITNDYGYFKFSAIVNQYKNYKIESDFYSLIKELNEKNIPNLVIDLRYNEGGDPEVGGRMMRYLADKPFRIFENEYISLCTKPTFVQFISNPFYFKTCKIISKREDTLRHLVRFNTQINLVDPKPDRFKGKIYVITGSITKSAATMFCKWLVGQSNVTFVGEETSGGINYFWAGGPKGDFVKFNLPNINTVFGFGIQLLELKPGSSKDEMPQGLIPDKKIIYTIEDRLAGKDLEMEWIKDDMKRK